MGWQRRRLREQARSHNSGSCTPARYESAVRPPLLASQLPQFESSTSARNRSAVRPPSLASQPPQKSKSKIKRSQPSAAPTVGSRELDSNLLTSGPPSRAGSLPQFESSTSARNRSLSGRHREQARSYSLNRVHQRETGRLAGRHREQAHSYKSKSKAAQLPAAKPPHSTMSASSSAFDLDPRATSEG